MGLEEDESLVKRDILGEGDRPAIDDDRDLESPSLLRRASC
jgi:hypothetical protein